MRFEYLLKTKSLDCSIFKSLDEIDERLDKDWDLSEEDALKKSNAHYTGICQEIVDIKSKWDSDSLTAPLKTLEQDPHYRAAREANADRIQEPSKTRIAPS